MDQLHDTHRSTVTPEQIDHLGHMNVRFYGVNAMRGTEAFLERCGGAADLRLTDVYTRHHREQLLGARLVVRTGVLEIGDDRLRLYHELVEESSGVLAASFVHTLVPLPEVEGTVADALGATAREWTVALPERGAPRSISLDADPLASVPDLEVLRSRGMAMRAPRTIGAEECAPDGRVAWSDAPGLIWAGEPVNGSVGPMLHEGPNGERMGWASMETRMSVRRLPERGDRIQSFGVVVALQDKTSHRVQWAFDVDRGDVLVVFEVVNLAFDTGGRRAMTIPDHVRADEERFLQPDLAPQHAGTNS